MAQLPLEIWALIIDHLADDRQAISVCSLVETRWVHLARKHLFETLLFAALGPQEAERLFWWMSIDLPVIAPYVRTLNFFYYNELDHDATSREHVAYLKRLASVLGSRVETLHLRQVVVSELPDFVPTEGFPHLRHLHFDHANFQRVDLMAAYVALFPVLHSFALNDCHFVHAGIPKDYTLPPLRELELSVRDYQKDILPWISRSGLASTLRRLKVLETAESDHEAISSFLSTFTPCLSTVIIEIYFQWEPSVTYVWPLITSNSLTSLEITWSMDDCWDDDAAQPLAKILENLRAPALKTMILSVDINYSVALPRDDEAPFPLDHFPSLQRLSVFFFMWPEAGPEPDTLEERIGVCASMRIFVAAREKGLLRAYFHPKSTSLDHNEPDAEIYFDGLTYQRS